MSCTGATGGSGDTGSCIQVVSFFSSSHVSSISLLGFSKSLLVGPTPEDKQSYDFVADSCISTHFWSGTPCRSRRAGVMFVEGAYS